MYAGRSRGMVSDRRSFYSVLRFLLLVITACLGLPAAHHPLPLQWSADFGDHRRLALLPVPFPVVNHNPVLSFLQLMSLGGVGKQGREFPALPPDVVHGQPGFFVRVEASGSNFAEFIGSRFLPVFTV